MRFRSMCAGLAKTAAAVLVMTVAGSAALASDVYVPPPPPAYGPAYGPVVGGPEIGGCASCQHGLPAASCTTCGKLRPPGGWVKYNWDYKKQPYQVNLCPGACNGYFQTQWRRWDDVCPYPYLGQGLSDAPRPGTPPKVPGGTLPPPRPFDPKTMPDPVKPALPPIPSAPVPGKFNP